jgi:Holliday junction resolvasome RuvABC endonuclease subunit
VALVALTSYGTDCIRARRQSGVEVFAQLISEVHADEADALAAAVTALTHLQRLEEERRNQSSPSPPSSAGQTHS